MTTQGLRQAKFEVLRFACVPLSGSGGLPVMGGGGS